VSFEMSDKQYKLSIQLANLRFADASAFGTWRPQSWWTAMKAEIDAVKQEMETEQ
jgi:hypothetical protein